MSHPLQIKLTTKILDLKNSPNFISAAKLAAIKPPQSDNVTGIQIIIL